eukprot:g741.t1
MDQLCTFCGSIESLVETEQGFICTVCGGATVITVEEDKSVPRTSKDIVNESQMITFIHVNKDRVMLAYVTTLQACLIAHVETLISLGVSPMLEPVARKIWLRTVEVSRALAPGSLHQALQEFSPLLKSHTARQSTEAKEIELEAEDRLYDHYASYTATLWRFLRLEVILWVLYAALVWIQEAILPIDLTMWIENGTLPFLKLNAFQEQIQGSFGINFPRIVFQPKSLPRPLEIEIGAAQLADDIGLVLPPMNFPLHIFRLCKTLDLSSYVAKIAVKLYGLYWKDSGWDRESPSQMYYPQTILGACIIVALKINYGLDDSHKRPLDGSQVVDWMQWARRIWMSKIRPVRSNLLTGEELLKMSSESLKEFVHFIDDTVMANCEYKNSYSDLDKTMEKLVSKWTSPDLSMAPNLIKTSTDYQPQPIKFKLGETAEYVPTLYLYPCRMYWFIPLTKAYAVGTDYHYPYDFAAVLSTISAVLNIKPKHLEAGSATLERDITLNELHCLSMITGSQFPLSQQLNAAAENRIITYALYSMGIDRRQIDELLNQDFIQMGKIRAEGPRVDPEIIEEEKLVDKAVRLYHVNFCETEKQLSDELRIPVVPGMTQYEKDSTLYSSNDNAEVILYRAELALALGEPLVTLGSRAMSRRRAFYHSQTHQADDKQNEVKYMSDPDLSSEED